MSDTGTRQREGIAALDARLPRKRCSAGLLLLDPNGCILIVKPTYRNEWLLPGGVVESDETPADAALRELAEECGMTAQLEGLLCTDIVAPAGWFSESVHFLFLASATDAQRAGARVDGAEVSALEWVDAGEAMLRLPRSSAVRLESISHGHRGYFEHGLPRLASLPSAVPLSAS